MTKAARPIICLAIILSVLTFSCRKKETLIGRNLIPTSDNLNGIFTDTVTLVTKTVREDSLLTQGIAKYVLGCMKDPVFGNSYAGIYGQVSISALGINLGDTAILDSTVLSLSLAGYYGDTTTTHNIRVYQLIDSMSIFATAQYKSRKTFLYNQTPIGQKSAYHIGKLQIDSSFKDVDGTNFGPSLRIALNPSVGQGFLNQTATGAYASNSSFLNYFEGVYIDEDSSSSTNSMIYANINSGSSYLGVYYHFPHSTSVLAPLRFYMGNGVSASNYFKHNYAGKIVKTALDSASRKTATILTDSVVYVQSMDGVKTWISLPNLANFKKSVSANHVLINKAEIEVTMASGNNADSNIFSLPAQMIIVIPDGSELHNIETVDETFPAGFPIFGGTKLYTTDASGHKYIKYKFSVAEELQKMLDNQYINNGFYLLTFPSNQIGDRIMIGGGHRNKDPYQMKLNLVYTKLP